MTIYFDGAGFQAEELCAKQFRGELITDTTNQYKDIDCLVRMKNGTEYTASVKDQRTSTKKFKSIQVETELYNSSNQKSTDGSLYKNESEYYFWLCYDEKDLPVWYIVKSQDLKDLVKNNKNKLKVWKTTTKTEEKNKSYGRYYNGAKGFVIPFSLLESYSTKVGLQS